MSSEYRGSSSDPNASNRRPTSELWGGQWGPNDPHIQDDDEDTQPHRAVRLPAPQAGLPAPQAGYAGSTPGQQDNAQFAHREHVTSGLPAYPSDAPLFRPAYMPYPPHPQQGQGSTPAMHPGYNNQGVMNYGPPVPGYPPQPIPAPQVYPGYPPYQGGQGYVPGYPYAMYPGYHNQGVMNYGPYMLPRPKQDGFRLAVVIVSLIASILVTLAGLACVVFLLLFIIGTTVRTSGTALPGDQFFNALMTLIAFALAGIVGGGFSIYHSVRGLLRKRSASLTLPWFWLFIIPYLLVIGIGYALRANGQEVAIPSLTAFLIILAAIFPALTLLALGVRRLRFPESTTSWRRFTLALTSGATLGIGLALLLELGSLVLIMRGQGANNFLQCIDNPDQAGCGSFMTFNYIFLIIAIIGPIIEETVKPLGVAFFIGRIRSAAEAFVLGMAAGIGFALVETVGYIGSGYHDWLSVALERTGASLLHGFGAGMVALGWYYLIHGKERRVLKALGCWAYAVFQHFVWNGTAVLSLLPAPAGPTLNSWNLQLGFITLPFVEILNIFEAILIFVFFIYMTGKLRSKTPSSPLPEERKADASREASWQPQQVPSSL